MRSAIKILLFTLFSCGLVDFTAINASGQPSDAALKNQRPTRTIGRVYYAEAA